MGSFRSIFAIWLVAFLFYPALSVRSIGAQPNEEFESLVTQVSKLLTVRKYSDAERRAQRALALAESSLGFKREHPDYQVSAMAGVAEYLQLHQRYVEAIPLLERELTVAGAKFPNGSVQVGEALENLAQAEMVLGNWRAAIAHLERASERGMLIHETQGGWRALLEIQASAHLAEVEPSNRDMLGRERFVTAQRAHSWANGTMDVASVASAALAKMAAGSRNSRPPQNAIGRPESIENVQAVLAADEALVLLLGVPDWDRFPAETFLWVVTKTQIRWVRIDLGFTELRAQVGALRCGLDGDAWDADGGLRCAKLLGLDNVSGRMSILPFDLARAYKLYQRLFGQVEDLTNGKQLLIVPWGPLASLPWAVLVTANPEKNIPQDLAEYRDVRWLGAQQPITVLPSVPSLRMVREQIKASCATKPYLGIGNPLLEGIQSDSAWGTYYQQLARAARDKRCTDRPAGGAARSEPRRKVPNFSELFRGSRADIDKVRELSPLPETADELCEVGYRLGATESDILLGRRATEKALKDLSDSGRLADYRIVHFATHGALAGEMRGSEEPGLILTPPEKGTSDTILLDRDDGYLMASEIAHLKMDAELVILSACNTAGGDEFYFEPLSGLASAFFNAGTRALLVSHWEVSSDAAVRLTTSAFAHLVENPGLGRAEAFRLSMRDLIFSGKPIDAHPSQWAPFVIVGEGGAFSSTARNSACMPEPLTRTASVTVRGAPGEGAVSVGHALERALIERGVIVSNNHVSGAYQIEALVVLGPVNAGKQRVRIDWLVKDSQDKKLGVVTQDSETVVGALDRDGDDTAVQIASGAVGSILKLLAPSKQTNDALRPTAVAVKPVSALRKTVRPMKAPNQGANPDWRRQVWGQ